MRLDFHLVQYPFISNFGSLCLKMKEWLVKMKSYSNEDVMAKASAYFDTEKNGTVHFLPEFFKQPSYLENESVDEVGI